MRVRLIRPGYWTDTRPESRSACSVYRLYGGSRELLYVGIADEPRWRLLSHLRTHWGRLIEEIEIEWHKSREEAAAAEKRAIRDEDPIFNRQRYRVSGASA